MFSGARVIRAILVATSLLAPTRSVVAQEMELPVALQVTLFSKVATFDRALRLAPGEQAVFAIVYQKGYRTSVVARDEAVAAIARNKPGINGSPLHAASIDLDAEGLVEGLARTRATVVYVAPLRAVDMAGLVGAIRAARLLSFSGVPAYVADGVAVGARRISDRPKLLVNIVAARKSGVDFSAELLKLSMVVE